MRNYKRDITLDEVNNILNFATERDIEFEGYEGTILDNYIVYNYKDITFKGIKARDFIILKSKYLNEWSSTTEMIFTDDEKLVNDYVELWEN